MPRGPILSFDQRLLRRVRDSRKLSRRSLAALCPSVSESAIRSYEDGKHKPDIDRALELARALGVTVEKLATTDDASGRSKRASTTEGEGAR